MADPAEMSMKQHCLDTWQFSPLESFVVGDIVLPVYSHDGSQEALVEAFQQLYVFSVQHPGFRSIQKSADDNFFHWAK